MSVRTDPRRRRFVTNAQQLLADALDSLDHDAIARMAGVPPDRLRRWCLTRHKTTIAQKAAIAVAVIAIAPKTSLLFRRAVNLRGQVCAAIEYELGITSATESGPKTQLWL